MVPWWKHLGGLRTLNFEERCFLKRSHAETRKSCSLPARSPSPSRHFKDKRFSNSQSTKRPEWLPSWPVTHRCSASEKAGRNSTAAARRIACAVDKAVTSSRHMADAFRFHGSSALPAGPCSSISHLVRLILPDSKANSCRQVQKALCRSIFFSWLRATPRPSWRNTRG